MTALAPASTSTRHPAPYPKYIFEQLVLVLEAERRHVDRPLRVLDPFAGIGRIHDLPKRIGVTTGVEIEPEWAQRRAGTIVGDATALPAEWTASFDAVVTSPCYGNRMADHHEARDSCFSCDGIGVERVPEGCGDAPMLCPDCHSIACSCGGIGRVMKAHVLSCRACSGQVCDVCKGSGLSMRYTYKHALKRDPSEGSSATMHWGADYRDLHVKAWREARRVLRDDGLILVNVKNHMLNDVEQMVAEWHEITLRRSGFDVRVTLEVDAPGMRNGANRDKRVAVERIICARAC